jgi:hypothetical protein
MCESEVLLSSSLKTEVPLIKVHTYYNSGAYLGFKIAGANNKIDLPT